MLRRDFTFGEKAGKEKAAIRLEEGEGNGAKETQFRYEASAKR